MTISEVDVVCTGSPSPEIQPRMRAMQSDFQIQACNSVDDSSELGQQVIDQLEVLDDTIFEALNGDVTALERSAGVWGSTLQNLGAEILEESRQQYLRQAETEWQRHRLQPSHSLPKVFTALEIISLLEGAYE